MTPPVHGILFGVVSIIVKVADTTISRQNALRTLLGTSSGIGHGFLQEAEAKRAEIEPGEAAGGAEARREEWQNEMQEGLLTVHGLEFDKKWIRLLRVIKTQVRKCSLLSVSLRDISHRILSGWPGAQVHGDPAMHHAHSRVFTWPARGCSALLSAQSISVSLRLPLLFPLSC